MSIIFWIIMGLLFCVGVFAPIIKQLEKGAFKKMVANPCDATVKSYISAFEKDNIFLVNIFNMDKAIQHRNELTRQGQGWTVVKNSANVSQEVKEQLKNVLIAHGVPIKM